MTTIVILLLILSSQTSGDTLPTLSLAFFHSKAIPFSPASPTNVTPTISSRPYLVRTYFLNTTSKLPIIIQKPLSYNSSKPLLLSFGKPGAAKSPPKDSRFHQLPEHRLVIEMGKDDDINYDLKHHDDGEDDNYDYHYSDKDEQSDNSSLPDGSRPKQPYLDKQNTSLSVFLGSTATFGCTVFDLKNESVSWLRLMDDMLELLTWGSHIYTSDTRYSMVQEMGENWQKWKLVIRDTRAEDQGQYRCHIATHPPLLKTVTLNITEPLVRIVDEIGSHIEDKHYKSGSMIELKCIIENVPFPHSAVIWKRGSMPLIFNTSGGGISIKGDEKSGYIRSRLYVTDASTDDAGVYSCWYNHYTSDNVTIHIIAGENSQAMQHDSLPETTTTNGSIRSHRSSSTSSWIILVLVNFCIFTTSIFCETNNNLLSYHQQDYNVAIFISPAVT